MRLLREDVEVKTWLLAQAKEDQHATAQEARTIFKGHYAYATVVGHFVSFWGAFHGV